MTSRDQTFQAVADEGAFETWFEQSTGKVFVVWMVDVPGEAPLPLAYHVPDPETFENIFQVPPDPSFTFTRKVPNVAQSGALEMGTTNRLPAGQLFEDEFNFDNVVEQYLEQTEIFPFLRDPQILAMLLAAHVENRDVSELDLQKTDWWRNHSEAERNWLTFSASDPESAQRVLEDQRLAAGEVLRSFGVNNADPSLINRIADKVTMGEWTVSYAEQQMGLLADPFKAGTLDPALSREGLDTTARHVQDVRDRVYEWLGPAHGNNYSQDFFERWGGRLRNDDDASDELTELLRRQRLALFPTYENPELRYEDIVAPWRNLWFNTWGERASETDPLFNRIVNLNDVAAAEQTLRKEGLKRGNQLVVRNAVRGLASTLGNPIR